jgi:hypothetical protein|tara:strand:- start:58 stop:276 length:219 start_codon:yes stop_codon:yes gene_type:complete
MGIEERTDYIITVRPEVYIEYTIEAASEQEAWDKYHNNEYESKEEDFTGFDWKPATIEKVQVTSIGVHYGNE